MWKGKFKTTYSTFCREFIKDGTYGDLHVKNCVHSLKENVFDKYDMETESIDCWEKLENQCLNPVYSNPRTTIIMELTNTKQRKDEI